MAKLKAKSRSAKVYDESYDEATSKSKAMDVSLFNKLLQDIAMSALQDQTGRFRTDFLNGVEKDIGVRFKDIIQPEGTRLCRQGQNVVCFVIEQPPTVRTITYKGRDGGTEERWTLAFPYMYFFPVFSIQSGTPELSGVGLACRTAPLSSLDDMLCCINLPNAYRTISVVPTKIPAMGLVPGIEHMVVCQGFRSKARLGVFKPEPDDFGTMAAEVIKHFWNSRFTNELDLMYRYMAGKEQKFSSFAVWQKHSLSDPLFVLGVDYPPAIRLNALLNDIMRLHDQNKSIHGQVNQYLKNIHDEVWKTIREDEEYKKVLVNLNEAVLDKFNEAMKKFSAELSKNVSSMSNDVVKRHLLLAITLALRAAMK